MTRSGMVRRRVLVLLAGGICALPLAGCDALGHNFPAYRYRLTVEVDTPEGLRTGSSVIEVHTSVASDYSIPTPGVVGYRVRGEAVAVDLGPRGDLFALLRTENDLDWPGYIMFRMARGLPHAHVQGGKYDRNRNFQAQFAAMLENRDLVALPSKFPSPPFPKGMVARPLLVGFKDIADPKSVERLDPDDLAITYGEGVRLRRITVQLTDDPVTTGIVRMLPWLPKQRGSLFPIPVGKSLKDLPVGALITEGDFKRGDAR